MWRSILFALSLCSTIDTKLTIVIRLSLAEAPLLHRTISIPYWFRPAGKLERLTIGNDFPFSVERDEYASDYSFSICLTQEDRHRWKCL